MKKNFNLGTKLFLCAGLALGMTACDTNESYPFYDDVVAPEVPVVPASLSGIVTTNGGASLANATVTLTSTATSKTATTDANGTYSFAGVANGTYTLKAELDGYTSATGSVVVSAGDAQLTWNALMPKVVKEEVAIVPTVAKTVAISIPSVVETASTPTPGEPTPAPAPAATATVEVPANTFSEPVTLSLEFVNSTSATQARATSSLSLLNMVLGASNASVVFNNPITLSVDIAAKPSSVTLNGAAINYTFADGKLNMELPGLGAISVNYNITSTSSNRTNTLAFSQSTWDNLYGTSAMSVTSTSYNMSVGSTVSGNNGLLKNVLALDCGASVVKTNNVTYPINMTLPIGTKLVVSGTQAVTTTTYSVGSMSATATIYGDTKVTAKTSNRVHTGGQN